MLAHRIKALREARRLSMAQLGTEIGVSAQAVCNWETIEGRGPSRDVLPRLAKALGVTVDDLLREDEQAPAAPAQPEPSATEKRRAS